MLGGELAVPFLSLGGTGATFTQYSDLTARFRECCETLLQRARLKGVEILLPTDVVIGDEPIFDASVLKSYSK